MPDEVTGAVYTIRTSDFVVTGSVSDTHMLLLSPTNIAFTPDGTKAYIADLNSVCILDPLNNLITGSVTGSFSAPVGIAFTADGTTACVANTTGNSVSIIDVAHDRVTSTLAGGAFSFPLVIAITPLGIAPTKAYVTNLTGTRVSIIDVADAALSGTVSAPFTNPYGIAITPNGTIAYVANSINPGLVNIIDLATNLVTGTVVDTAHTLNDPSYIAISPDGTTAYVANSINPGSISIIDLTTNRVTSAVPVGSIPVGLAITPDGQEVWVVNQGSKSISIIGYAISSLVNVQGCQTRQIVLNQTDLVNVLTWQAPVRGTPTHYNIYRDAALTDLAGTVTASANPLEFLDHNRQPGVTYTYYIVAVDSSGGTSVASVITVTQLCDYALSNLVNPRGCQAKNVFLTQTELVNVLTWQPPTTGTPVRYILYRDAALTDVAGSVLATANPLEFVDRNRRPGVTYTYYIVAVDASGNTSATSVIAVTQACSKK